MDVDELDTAGMDGRSERPGNDATHITRGLDIQFEIDTMQLLETTHMVVVITNDDNLNMVRTRDLDGVS